MEVKLLGVWVEAAVRFNVVLCGISLSPGSANVVAYAAQLACWHTGRLRILHVVSPGTHREPEHVERFYTENVPVAVRLGIPHESVIVEGDVAEALSRAANEPDVDIVVAGFHHARLPFSSHRFDQVAHRIGKPLLGVPTGCVPPDKWRIIVVGTDLSDASCQTQAAAAAIAEASGARMLAIHVVSDVPAAFAAADPLAVPAYRDFAIEEAVREMGAAFGPLPECADFRVCSGSVSDQLRTVVQREHADLVVVGLHPDGHRLLPSVADQLLDTGRCAVLAVPHAKVLSAAR